MKKTLLNLILILSFIAGGTNQVWAQCANDNVLVPGNLTPPGVSLSTTQTFGTGQYVLANVIAGANYTISTCGNSNFDSQLTVYDNTTGTFLAYNDDYCGVQSTVNFTPTFCGDVRVLLDLYFCTTGSSSMDVTMTMNTAGSGLPSLNPASDVSACNGGTALIGIPGNGSGGIPPYSYQWNPSLNLSNATSPQTTATITATQAYDLTLVDANGCKAYDTVLVSVLPNPTVFLGNDTTVCGGPVTLDAGNVGSSYLWSTGAGTQTIAPTSSGMYSVSVQNAQGCIGNDAIAITVNPLPTVSIGPDTTSCSNAVIMDAGPGYASYVWSTGDPTQTSSVTSSGPVSVVITDGNGCSASDTAVVTLSPAPVVNLGPDVTQCGGTVTMDAQNPGAIYFWSNSTSNQTATVSTTGTYFVQVITPAGCSNADTMHVTINTQPVVNLGPDTSICGSSVFLDAGNVGSNYLWSNSAQTQTVTVSAGTYSVTVTDPSGCSDADTIVVTTNSSPPVDAGLDVAICTGQNATLTATGAMNYIWSTGATTTSISVSPTINTTYYVTGYDINGCYASSVVSVTVIPAEHALFTQTVTGATANFTNLSTNAVSYSWNFGDGSPVNNTANPSHTYLANGPFTVTLTVTGPCGTDTYTLTVTITQVGLQDNDLAETLSIFPNPNDGVFTLSFDFTKAKDVTIQVLDVSGREVFLDEEANVTSYNKQIGLETAESGMYFVRILTTDGVVTQKIMIQR